MRRSALYINGGGTLIQNATSRRSLWYYLFTLRLAKFLGNKVDMYGCGIGPVTGKRNVRLVKKVLDRSVDVITLRETDSMAELRQFGVKRPEIVLSSDPALVLSPAPEGGHPAVPGKARAGPPGQVPVLYAAHLVRLLPEDPGPGGLRGVRLPHLRPDPRVPLPERDLRHGGGPAGGGAPPLPLPHFRRRRRAGDAHLPALPHERCGVHAPPRPDLLLSVRRAPGGGLSTIPRSAPS